MERSNSVTVRNFYYNTNLIINNQLVNLFVQFFLIFKIINESHLIILLTNLKLLNKTKIE